MQLSTLTRLHTLHLQGNFTPASSDVLLCLTSLHKLQLSDWRAPPACLPSLIWLRDLYIQQRYTLGAGMGGDDYADADELPASPREVQAVRDTCTSLAQLTDLTALTSLRLSLTHTISISALPPSLSSLSQLQLFFWEGGAKPPAQLPAGLAGLRVLALPADLVLHCSEQLQSLQTLEHLAVWDFGINDQPALAAVRRLADQAPSLRHLLLAASADSCRKAQLHTAPVALTCCGRYSGGGMLRELYRTFLL